MFQREFIESQVLPGRWLMLLVTFIVHAHRAISFFIYILFCVSVPFLTCGMSMLFLSYREERNNLAKAIYLPSHFPEWSNLTNFLSAQIGARSADFCPTWDWDQFLSFYAKFGTSRCRISRMYGCLPESTRSITARAGLVLQRKR